MFKYIVVKNRQNGKEEIFLFPNSVNHDVFATSISRLKNQAQGMWKREIRDVVAAGFVGDCFECYGRSETLNLDSRKIDTILLRGD